MTGVPAGGASTAGGALPTGASTAGGALPTGASTAGGALPTGAFPPGGPRLPDPRTPPRAPGSVRRTSSIDTSRPDGLDGDAFMDGRARDIVTRPDGSTEVVAQASLWARVGGFTRELKELRSEPDRPALHELAGALVGPGFRGRVDRLVPEERDAHTPLYLLLDDFPGAALVSGYALLHAGSVGRHHDGYLDAQVDQCAGWAAEGGMMQFIRREQRAPQPLGPRAPVLERPDDAESWHEMAELAPHGMRRRRRIDVGRAEGGAHPVNVFFRDSHVDGDGRETVVHEYGVSALVDAASLIVRSVVAKADVLPWAECPAAVGSAPLLVGQPVGDLRPWGRANLRGTTTCTHLNDTLRGLADVGALIEELAAGV
ncbi:MAG TPA: DUF2889 domain-containing protein [Acidimicrobiales bacterium]|nr:DUF2889 domain-containing protein [Acidimicrobiales bacterium]